MRQSNLIAAAAGEYFYTRFQEMIGRRGVYFAVSPHHGFSAAHTEPEMDRVLAAMDDTLEELFS